MLAGERMLVAGMLMRPRQGVMPMRATGSAAP
jgi:hypothetical protein